MLVRRLTCPLNELRALKAGASSQLKRDFCLLCLTSVAQQPAKLRPYLGVRSIKVQGPACTLQRTVFLRYSLIGSGQVVP